MKKLLHLWLLLLAFSAPAQVVIYNTRLIINGAKDTLHAQIKRDLSVYPRTAQGEAAINAAISSRALSVSVLNGPGGSFVRVLPALTTPPSSTTVTVPSWLAGQLRYSHTGQLLTLEASGNIGEISFQRQNGQAFTTTNPDGVSIKSGTFYGPGTLSNQGAFDKQWQVNLSLSPYLITLRQQGGVNTVPVSFTPVAGANRVMLIGTATNPDPPVCTTCTSSSTGAPSDIAFNWQPLTTNVNNWPITDNRPWVRMGGIVGRKVQISNGKIKVGFWERSGGAVCEVFDLEGPTPNENIVNNADNGGRQLQDAFYRGGRTSPNPNAEFSSWATPDGKLDPAGGGTGNNPITAGSAFNDASIVDIIAWNETSMYIKSRLVNWPVRNEITDVVLERWYVLVPNTAAVKVFVKTTNNRADDKTNYGAYGQEYPCVYANEPYRWARWYAGNEPFTGAAPTVTDEFGTQSAFAITEPWIANTNQAGRGVGITAKRLYEVTHKRQCPDCGWDEFAEASPYVSFQPQIHIDWNQIMYGEYHIMTGHVNDMRQYALSRNWSRSLAYNWKNSLDRGWWFRNWATDPGVPLAANGWTVIPQRKQGSVNSPRMSLPASANGTLYIRMAYTGPLAKLYLNFWRSDMNPFGIAQRVEFPVIGDGVERTIAIPVSKNAEWRGIINRISIQRYIDFGLENQDTPVSGESFRFVWINNVNQEPAN